MISPFEILAGPFGDIAEGPVWDGRYLTFTLILQSRVMRYDPETRKCVEWASNTRRTNGLAQDPQGRIYGCSAESRAIVRFDSNGSAETIVDRFGTLPLNTPNDLVVDRAGRIWFSNPWNPPLAPDGVPEVAQDVFRADPRSDGSWNVLQITSDMTKPNGIALSANEQVLYVAQSDFGEDRVRELRAYPILNDRVGPYTTLYTFGIDHRGVHRGIDGMRLDMAGNIVATAGWHKSGPGPLLYVFDPSGRVLATREVPTEEGPSNCAFGGPDLRTLYVTTVDGYLLSTRMEIPGLPVGPLRP